MTRLVTLDLDDAGALDRLWQELERTHAVVAPEAERNHALNRAAFSIGQLIAGGEIGDHVGAMNALLTAGRRAGLGETECTRTIRSGLDAGAATA